MKKDNNEQGCKWWIEKVIIPIFVALIGGGGVCGIIAFTLPFILPILNKPTTTTTTIMTVSATSTYVNVDMVSSAPTEIPVTEISTATPSVVRTILPPPTPTSMPSNTATIKAADTPRPSNTPVASHTPSPTPGGIGTGTETNEFRVILIDYEFRSTASSEDDIGVAKVTFSFFNDTGQQMEIVVNWLAAEGSDNLGTRYGELYSVGARRCEDSALGCTFGAPDASKLENYTILIPANSSTDLFIEIQEEGKSIYEPMRVSIETDYIDLNLPSIKYRTDKLYVVSGQWRLLR